MKRIFSLLIIVVLTFNVNAQKSPNKFDRKSFRIGSPDDKFKAAHNQLSTGVYYGFHGSLSDVSINPLESHALLINTRLFIRPSFGVDVKFGFDQFNTKVSQSTKSYFADVYVDVFYDVRHLFSFDEVNYNFKKEGSNFKLLAHAGVGVASMWNRDFTSPTATDPYFINHDDIVNINLGISPELRLSNHLSVGIDFSVKFNYLQDRSFNYAFENISKQARMYALMVGINYFY
jgi:hypothetical protein